jgi:hypothetical protein
VGAASQYWRTHELTQRTETPRKEERHTARTAALV